ncbi:MAG: hypothetical protein COB67_00610 [SAR324 cluster bacterium]|uniref:Acyl carrier protein n=1 Tax=SAR324 cluster bacterium TaxID=2024889 RepID=A0A2A4TBT4_9DELT|nr:MAG: hypothetical protein COB67_00610 [SAR324 cluster bacterium]
MTMGNEITTISTVKNRDEISFEAIKKLKDFTLDDDIDESTLIESIEIMTLREPIEKRFGLFIMNDVWEDLKTVGDIVNTIEKIMVNQNRIVA